ncbi:MAG: FliI/YscN family ATPase [bacterium]
MNLSKYQLTLKRVTPIKLCGKVRKIIGIIIEGSGPGIPIGGICEIDCSDRPPVKAEVIGFRDDCVLMMPLGDVYGIKQGSTIRTVTLEDTIKVGPQLLGRVIDALGRPIDNNGELVLEEEYPFYSSALRPLQRERIWQPLDVGIRAINSLLTIGKGQKMGIFAGSGLGKSILMGQIARNTEADMNVIALIGERGREVKEFIEKNLGKEGLKKSVLVTVTSDEPPLLRRRGAFVATTLAEYFRDQGHHVLLMMDSLTRFAMAQREIGLAIGEPPATRSYTPSVFSSLPSLLERVGGLTGGGSITGLYTVLVEGDDMNEPIADSTRAIFDGHIVLSRDLAVRNHYPAIDILHSLSRVMKDIITPEHQKYAHRLRETLATYQRVEDLIQIGAYKSGNNPKVDYALDMIDSINTFLRQEIGEKIDLSTSLKSLQDLFAHQ